MEQRPLGRTGVVLSAIGFGCGRLAQLMIGDDDEARIEAVRTALDGGISYFDTADSYGAGRSELNLARAFRELGVKPSVVTKVTLEPDDLGDPRSAVLRRFGGCLERLDRERVDVLLLHNQVFDHVEAGARGPVGARLSLAHVFGAAGVAAAFAEIRAAGLARAVAFTAFGGDVPAIREMIDSGAFGAFNVTLNLLNPSAALTVGPGFAGKNFGRIVERGAARGLGVMAVGVLAQGALAAGAAPGGRDREVVTAALAQDASLPSAATRYVLGIPGISTAVLGFSTPDQVRAALAAERLGRLSAAAIAAIERAAVA